MPSVPTAPTPPPELAQLLDTVGACVFAKDMQGRYSYANTLLLQALGLRLEQLLGGDAADHLDAEVAARIAQQDLRVLHLGETVSCEERWLPRDGSPARTYWTVRSPLHAADGNICGLCCVATDISERKAMEAQLLEQRQLLDVVLNSVDAYVYMKDENRRYRYINDKVARDWGVRPEDVVGKLDRELLPTELADRFWELDRKVFRAQGPVSSEETHTGPDGATRHHWSTKVPVRYEGVPTLIGFSTDISELVRLREQLRQQALSDGLTGLCNRRHFNDLTEKELARARRHGLSTALLMLDIDHFKRINDAHGHPQGDLVLQRLGALLRQQLRREDSAARVGGEEFALLLPRTDREAALVLAERIRIAVLGLRDLLPGGGGISCSLGVAVCARGSDRLEQLYARADAQLYRAKQEGRDRVCA
jgi:diguanylate cyclase (GGDEF)-like protein/PAS domain S-box-containing protein